MDVARARFAIAPVIAAAALGGLGARRAPETYARLVKPRWAPPAAVFGPVWTALYVTIAVAGWRIARTGSAPTRRLHLIGLGLNAAWPSAFFAARHRSASIAVIVGLDLALAAELRRLADEDPAATRLLAPYAAWSLFATALNAKVSDPGSAGG